jgi:hypothetical protein
MGTFFGVFCGPRLRNFNSIFRSAAGSAENGLKRATSSAVISLTSPSSSINGFGNGLRFAIELCLPLVGFAKADDADSVRFGDVAEKVQSPVQIPHGNPSHFVIRGIARDQCGLEIEIRNPLEGESALADVALITWRDRT